jgi:phosphatidylinositol alpha-mannosyltransferase
MPGAYRILPNAVDVEHFAKAEPCPATPGPVILFVGRHEERKGLRVLLEAFAGLDRDAVLWVAGEGPLTDELRANGTPRVEWLGRVSDDELARRLRTAAVFCAPSTGGESFGIVLVEAMAAGTPVVASDIGGYRDVARAGREAVLVAPEDPAALRGGLRKVLDDPGLAGRLAEAGRERAATFSMASLAERYVDLYETAVAVERGRRG